MQVIDGKLLDAIKEEPCCWCGNRPADPHHIFTKGMGGGAQLDIQENVVPLCRTCHDDYHAARKGKRGRLLKIDLIAIAAARCRTTQESIKAKITELRRLT